VNHNLLRQRAVGAAILHSVYNGTSIAYETIGRSQPFCGDPHKGQLFAEEGKSVNLTRRSDIMIPKTLLVTGGAGFIGTNFVRQILAERPQWRIVNLDVLTYAGNLANFQDLTPDLAARHRFVHGAIQDSALLEQLFREETFAAVVHFAAESHVDRSIFGPEAFVETNVMGTFRLLEASLRQWQSRGKPKDFCFLHISTDEVIWSERISALLVSLQ
jgi:FlaA1/EpsC-like NDP-sugar epimerase